MLDDQQYGLDHNITKWSMFTPILFTLTHVRLGVGINSLPVLTGWFFFLVLVLRGSDVN